MLVLMSLVIFSPSLILSHSISFYLSLSLASLSPSISPFNLSLPLLKGAKDKCLDIGLEPLDISSLKLDMSESKT